LDDVTRALRAESPEILAGALRRRLQREPTPVRDYRDLLVALAPVYDCATRLGLDQVAFFDRAAHGLPGDVAEIARRFARRDDITPQAFHFAVEETHDGRRYRWSDRAAEQGD
jgi:hypothetical protein